MIKCTMESIASSWGSLDLLEVDLVVFGVAEVDVFDWEALHL